MEAPQVLSPPLLKMIWNLAFDFLHQPGSYNADHSARLHELSKIVQVQVISSEVREGVNTDNSIEEAGSKGQRARISMQWKHAVLGASISDALNVFGCTKPQIGCPD